MPKIIIYRLPQATLCPRPPTPSSRHWSSEPLWLHFPVSHIFRFYSQTVAYTGPIIHCTSHRTPSIHPPSSRPVYRPSTLGSFSMLHSPCPHLPPTLLYLTETTPPTLADWWFSTRGTQPLTPLTDTRPSCTNPSIGIYQPLFQYLPLSRYWLTTRCLLDKLLSSSPFLPSPFHPAFHSGLIFSTLWLVYLNAEVIGQSLNRRGVA